MSTELLNRSPFIVLRWDVALSFEERTALDQTELRYVFIDHTDGRSFRTDSPHGESTTWAFDRADLIIVIALERMNDYAEMSRYRTEAIEVAEHSAGHIAKVTVVSVADGAGAQLVNQIQQAADKGADVIVYGTKGAGRQVFTRFLADRLGIAMYLPGHKRRAREQNAAMLTGVDALKFGTALARAEILPVAGGAKTQPQSARPQAKTAWAFA